MTIHLKENGKSGEGRWGEVVSALQYWKRSKNDFIFQGKFDDNNWHTITSTCSVDSNDGSSVGTNTYP